MENGSVLVEGKTLKKDSASLIESSKENICCSEPDVCSEEHSSKPDGCLSAGAARKSDSVKPVAEESLKSGVCLLSGAAICNYSTKPCGIERESGDIYSEKKSSLGLDNAFSEKKNSIDFCDACLERKNSKVGYSTEPSVESGNTSSEKKGNIRIVQFILIQ